MPEGLKIVRLTAENLKRLRAVDITPDGNTVVIAGRNGQGKTSVLDAIWFALGGGKATAETARPVRDGAEGATVTLDLGDFTVTRKWDAGGKSTLTVTSKDGAKYGSPQAFLDEKLGALSFDPLAFSGKSDKEQLATLMQLVELPFDPEELAVDRQRVYEQRTDVNRRVKETRSQIGDRPRPSSIPPIESVQDLVDELTTAETIASWHRDTERDLRVARAGVAEEMRRLEEAQAALALATERAKELPPLPDTEAVKARMNTLEESNAAAREATVLDGLYEALEAVEAEADTLTAELDRIDAWKAKELAAANMPIDGLGFDEDGVTYNGIPFRQCSAAERLRVSLAMAMALNPTIRVIRITDGSLLDRDNMALIEEMAAGQDFQVWVERVEEGSAVGFTIEDGEVVA